MSVARLASFLMCKDPFGFKQMNSTANNESPNLWRNSLVMLGLLTAHVIINHRFVSLGAPVGTDPCDGVNGFAFFTIVFIAIGSTLRMFSGHQSSSPLRYLYIVRSQQAVLFAIFITFTAEIIALIRNPETWIGNRFAESVFALVGALTVVTVATLLLILVTQRNRISLSSLRWTRTILPVVIAIVVLTVCPEWPTYSPSRTAHILTVALGALVVFIPMRLLLPEIVLNGSDGHRETRTFGTAREWTLLLGAVAVVLLGFFRHVPIFVDHLAMLFIAYALLGAILGFAGSPKNSTRNAHEDK
jgi:hypothetical protein